MAKVGHLKVEWSRRLPAAPTSLTVTKDSCGRYFLSFVVDTKLACHPAVARLHRVGEFLEPLRPVHVRHNTRAGRRVTG
ncbi:hypothetical protein [Streptomyces fungicidicus]